MTCYQNLELSSYLLNHMNSQEKILNINIENFYWREMLVNINEWKWSDSNADEFFCGTALRSVWSILITCRQINTYTWFASMKNWIYGIWCCMVILMTNFNRKIDLHREILLTYFCNYLLMILYCRVDYIMHVCCPKENKWYC